MRAAVDLSFHSFKDQMAPDICVVFRRSYLHHKQNDPEGHAVGRLFPAQEAGCLAKAHVAIASLPHVRNQECRGLVAQAQTSSTKSAYKSHRLTHSTSWTETPSVQLLIRPT